MSNVALGKPVLEKTVSNPGAVTDGVITGYTESAGYASFKWPGSLTVDLQRHYRLKYIRLLLWDGRGQRLAAPDPRRYKYRLLISRDAQAWDLLYETGPEGSVGWQVFHITEGPTSRFIRVEGLHNTANSNFHVVELEAHEAEPPMLPDSDVMLETAVQSRRHRSSATPHSVRRPKRGRALQSGMVLDSYRLIQRLGKGHSATVWKGEVLRQPPGIRLTQGDVVAIKVYDQALLSGHESIRIQREFAVASEVDHPCLTKVFDVVISPSRPWHTFLVMEYVAGRTLKQHLSDQGPLETRAVLSIGKQLFDGLDALHTGGALHRDVKAANIILVDPQQVRVKLLDFGIVSVDADQGLTASSVFLGSKHSAPLEQLTGKTLDVRADIYSVGTVLFHCYEGRPPYENAGPEGGIVERMLNNPDVLKSKGPADSALTAFINRCLDNNRGRRPATASDARSEIEALIRGSGPTTGIWTPPSRGK